MTVLEAIQQANSEAKIPTLSFATIKEFSQFFDQFRFEDVPVNVVLPFDDNGVNVSGRRTSTIPLQGWVLTRCQEETLDLRSLKAEAEYINPMRTLAKKFITRLLDTDIIDPEVEEVSDSIRPAYLFLAHQLFGVSYTVNIPVSETIC